MSQNLAQSLSQSGILTPDLQPLLSPNFVPTTALTVQFGESPVSFGSFFRASECKEAPTVSFSKEADDPNASKRYTLLLIDPDAPTPDDPKFAYWRHWVVSGLRPAEAGDVTDTATVLTEYLGPGPKDESKPHRYLYLLFREPEQFTLSKNDVGGEEFTQRRSFKAAEWVEQYGLKLVAVNWMRGVGDGWKE
ncbi:phosphatidylethanolamine-binding protein [Aspergillus ambiguus]|uniref:YbhB/YbcL family Raf kinase inhibitor-like protein n=1 Tax=Aspergillus ambiguus TaxID=176160 RepID=UPI003CCDA07B